MRILAFAATTSSKSINAKLIGYAARLLTELGAGVEAAKAAVTVETVDLSDYEMPIYSQDREEADGVPDEAKQLFAKIQQADGLLISYAEHNGSYTAAFKNTYDWMSRIDMKVYAGKPMVLLATSPGGGGGRNVLAAAATSAPHFGGEVRGRLSVPNFHQNFDAESGELTDQELRAKLRAALQALMVP